MVLGGSDRLPGGGQPRTTAVQGSLGSLGGGAGFLFHLVRSGLSRRRHVRHFVGGGSGERGRCQREPTQRPGSQRRPSELAFYLPSIRSRGVGALQINGWRCSEVADAGRLSISRDSPSPPVCGSTSDPPASPVRTYLGRGGKKGFPTFSRGPPGRSMAAQTRALHCEAAAGAIDRPRLFLMAGRVQPVVQEQAPVPYAPAACP